MDNFWDQRFASEEYVYGTNPNVFMQQELLKLKPGRILIPGEGEGRNAVYAATKGWKVYAFDSSTEGRKKAMKLAEANKVSISYDISDYQSFKSEEEYDALVLIFTHMPSSMRTDMHRKFINYLRPGGHLIMQVFSKEQLGLTSGGPQNLDLLSSEEELRQDFKELSKLEIKKEFIELNEGPFHKGLAHVLSVKGIK